jgi:hypothetical protein
MQPRLFKTPDPCLPAHCWVTGTGGSRISFVTARCSWIEVAIGVKNPAGPLDRALQSLSCCSFLETVLGSHTMGRGVLLWLLGIPIPVIILLYLFHVM